MQMYDAEDVIQFEIEHYFIGANYSIISNRISGFVEVKYLSQKGSIAIPDIR